ncbi:MAG: hypothetical protein KAV82_07940 [Phycisphaerae bacterium]|nr:hypothetical protein [Phycisphaerae bacterium]
MSVCVLLAGCQTTTNMRLGERAERQGYYHRAYEYYCDEAQQRPSRGTVQAAIARVAPRAARHYEQLAGRAADQNNYAEAWRLYMRTLTITPDDAAIVRVIKMLEQYHPEEVAPAKAAWAKQGEKALMVASAASRPRSEAGRSQPHRQEELQTATGQPSGHEPTAAEEAEITTVETPSHDSGITVGRSRESDTDYLMTAILSVKDHRFPRRSHLIDDIHVRLKDTDPDPDADFDLYLGSRRVAKARDVKPGHGMRIRGRSGKWYVVVVIAIVDRTESVRMGVLLPSDVDGEGLPPQGAPGL